MKEIGKHSDYSPYKENNLLQKLICKLYRGEGHLLMHCRIFKTMELVARNPENIFTSTALIVLPSK